MLLMLIIIDVVIGWLCKDVADELLCRGYLPELVVFDNEIDPYIFLERGCVEGTSTRVLIQ